MLSAFPPLPSARAVRAPVCVRVRVPGPRICYAAWLCVRAARRPPSSSDPLRDRDKRAGVQRQSAGGPSPGPASESYARARAGAGPARRATADFKVHPPAGR